MRLVYETRQNISSFLAARLVFVTVLLGVGALFVPTGTDRINFAVLFGVNAVYSLVFGEWFRRRKETPSFVRGAVLTGAVILDTLVLHHAGGADSEFVFLYFFSIGAAGLLTGLPGSLWTALLSAGGVVWLYGEVSDYSLASHAVRAYLLGVNFLLTAFLASYAFEKLRKREEKHAEVAKELERTRLDTQAILDSLPLGVVVLDPQSRILYHNPACLHVVGCDEQAGVPELNARLRSVPLLYANVQSVADGERQNAQFEASVELDGSERPIRVEVSQLLHGEDGLRGHIILLEDMTAQREAERVEREREGLASIGRLSRELAHEIRNPLATVRGCVEMIQCSEPETSENRPYLDLALREADRLNTLLRDFLTFAHTSSPKLEPGDLAALIRERSIVLPDAVRLDLSGLTELPCEFDPDQMRLALDAMLLALAEWSEGNGEIAAVRGVLPRTSVRLVLKGKALPRDARAGAFQPFSTSGRASNGLALATAMRAVHAHGGAIILSADSNVGTWFELAI